MIQCKLLSSMSKVFMDRAPEKDLQISKASCLLGEVFAFQIAFQSDFRVLEPMRIDISDSPLKAHIKLKQIEPVLATHLGGCIYPGCEIKEKYERTTPGLFPDVLKNDISHLNVSPYVWYSVWCEISVPVNFKAGVYPLSIRVYDGENSFCDVSLDFEVINAVLPVQKLIHTEWFYCDCICHEHRVKPWTKRFWNILEKYFLHFSSHGMNLLYTPIFTPSLDTARGFERLTTQLIQISKEDTQYSLDFSLLRKWVRLAKKCGITHFEMAHLFTQWGADATPKITAKENGIEKRIFGWDVPACSESYCEFLNQFLPQLTAELKSLGIAENTYFHISDEPCTENLAGYKSASEMVRPLLSGFKILDAASHTEFFTQGLVSLPVPSECELHRFMPLNVPERWTYYCGGPELPYSNRLHSMPASANRIMGTLLYIYQVEGFLHWGYNFWNSLLSRRSSTALGTDADQGYTSGDTCIVYPGEDAPLCSMRGEVFFHGLEDMRALQLLESLSNRETVLSIIQDAANGKDVFINSFPLDQNFLFSMREQVNAKIKELIEK